MKVNEIFMLIDPGKLDQNYIEVITTPLQGVFLFLDKLLFNLSRIQRTKVITNKKIVDGTSFKILKL